MFTQQEKDQMFEELYTELQNLIGLARAAMHDANIEYEYDIEGELREALALVRRVRQMKGKC